MSSDVSESITFDYRNPADRRDARRIARAWIELRRGALTSELREYLYGHEQPLEQGQMDALDVLVRRERTMSGLAERMRIDPSTATRAVQSLVADGLAERFPSREDGRVVMVRVSVEGRARHSDVATRRNMALKQILDSFDPTERATLADLLDRFVDALDRVVTSLPSDDEGAAEKDRRSE